jgi:hypothetical protein
MSVSPKVRFEVFKRDRFTCSYCGRTPPTVLLEVDHIVPTAAGGGGEITNLTTSCQDCNRGKSAGLLQEGTAPVVNLEAVAEMTERAEQARQYAVAVDSMRRLQDALVQRVIDTWADAYGATNIERDGEAYWSLADGEFPQRATIRRLLGRGLTVDDILEAVDITASKMPVQWGDEACRYFYGVCWRSMDRLEGRTR